MRELARRAGLAQNTVANVLSGQRNAGCDFCISVARALDAPPEKLLRLADILPPLPTTFAEQEEELLHIFRQLPADKRQIVLDMIRGAAKLAPVDK